MARTALTVQQITRAGLTPVYSAANVDGHSVPNTGREFVVVKTIGTGTTVTVVTPGTEDGLAIADRAIVLGTNTERMIGPFPGGVYGQSDDSVHLDFSAVTAVTIGAFKA